MEKGGAKMEHNKTNKGDEIHRNSYEFHISLCIHIQSFMGNSHEIRTNFVLISCEFRPIRQCRRQTHNQAHLAIIWTCD